MASAPAPAILKQMSPERIYLALTKGDMVTMAQNLTDVQKRDIAEWVGGRPLRTADSGDAKAMSNVCSSNPPIKSLTSTPSRNGWSADLSTTRFQTAKAADLSPAAVSRLQLKWAFGLPSATSVYGQPTIVDGRVFVSSDAGYIYALDAETGCVHWSFQAQTGVRSAITIGPTKAGSTKYAAFFGDIHGNVYSVDATDGKLLWKVPVDPLLSPGSRVPPGSMTAESTFPFLPWKSRSHPVRTMPAVRFAAWWLPWIRKLGKQIWKTYTIPDKPITRTTPDGKTYIGTAGVGVWGPLTIDPKRHALYLGTGNTFSGPDVGRSDALIALDVDTGKVLWVQQDQAEDVWHTGCPQGPPPAGFPPINGTPRSASSLGLGVGSPHNGPHHHPPMPPSYYCPDKLGPDWDFSAGVMLVNLPNGKSLLVAGQKSGVVWAHDPDQKGALVWHSDISRGQIVFGGAADNQKAYFGMGGGNRGVPPGGLAAVRLSDGLEEWYTSIPPQEFLKEHHGITAAVTLIPGVVFTAGLDGMLRAFRTLDGAPLWQYDTTQAVETINGVKAAGGSIGSAGATVANGMVFVTSGYTGFEGGTPGNLLLAFAP